MLLIRRNMVDCMTCFSLQGDEHDMSNTVQVDLDFKEEDSNIEHIEGADEDKEENFIFRLDLCET